jgi:hypothetical protein
MLIGTLALAALSLAPSAQAAGVTRIDVPAVTAKVVGRINQGSDVPVLLPDAIVVNGAGRKAYASGAPFRRGWVIDLGYAPGCNGANACALASFFGERSGTLGGRANATLAGGVRARYKPLSCGGSCSPPTLTFVVRRVAYTFSVKDPAAPARATLVRMANAAVRAGARP